MEILLNFILYLLLTIIFHSLFIIPSPWESLELFKFYKSGFMYL